ncbi:MAG: AAA family ATPase, partial [Acidobacteriota bacterium]|nr:AAA family ATPase [Acidobacteriota bacterium]
MRQVLCPEVVGRAAELQVLEAALADALEGKGGCVVVAGDAGIGKSRLVRELSALAGGRGVPVVTGRAVPASSSTPFRPLTEALLQLLRDRSLLQDPGLQPWLSHLAALLPGIVEAGASSLSDGLAGGEAARGEAVLRLLRSLCPQGAVMALEDMHWADPDTVSLLEYLADNATGERLLLVVSLRGDPASPAVEMTRRQRGRAGVVQVTLTRLSEPEVAAMLDACGADLDADARARVVRASDGIPLLVEELLASPGLPESIVDTVRARMTELSDDDRAVLEAAAVMGRHFDWEILPA